LSDRPTLQELLEVQAFFGLPSAALVEKDWHVVRALAAIVAADVAPIRLVFGGGTALSRAHRLVKRMSEDIDLRIVGQSSPSRGALRRVRETVVMQEHWFADRWIGLQEDFIRITRTNSHVSGPNRWGPYRLPDIR